VNRLYALLAPIVLIGLILGAWETACRALNVPAYFLPPPSAIAGAAAANAPALLQSAWNTLSMALVALVIASAVAMTLALIVAPSVLMESAVRPLAVALQVTPIVAVAPQAVIWAGLDHPERAVVGLAAVVAFFPIFSGALTGLRSADPDLERLFDLYGATRTQRLFRLRLPSAAPFILEGHKVAAGLAIVGAVVAEFVAGSGSAQGLAWRILEAANRLQIAKEFAAVAVLGIMGVALHALVHAGERAFLARWRGRR
jgi:NitT/TauT family transport system permease protein